MFAYHGMHPPSSPTSHNSLKVTFIVTVVFGIFLAALFFLSVTPLPFMCHYATGSSHFVFIAGISVFTAASSLRVVFYLKIDL